jgi:hypothetical protein
MAEDVAMLLWMPAFAGTIGENAPEVILPLDFSLMIRESLLGKRARS